MKTFKHTQKHWWELEVGDVLTRDTDEFTLTIEAFGNCGSIGPCSKCNPEFKYAKTNSNDNYGYCLCDMNTGKSFLEGGL